MFVVAVVYGSLALGIPRGDGEPGPGIVPLALAVLLAAVSVVVAWNGMKKVSGRALTSTLGTRPLLAALATAGYAILFQPLGFVVSTLAFSAAITRLFTRDRGMLVAVPIAVTAVLFSFFRLALGVRLPPLPL